MKYLPELHFELDHGPEEAERLETLLRRAHEDNIPRSRTSEHVANSQDWDAAVDALREANEVVLACHVNPDGDALGSLLATSLGPAALGKKTYPTWGATGAERPVQLHVPARTSTDSSTRRTCPRSRRLVAFDCGAADRLGELERTPSKAQTPDQHRPPSGQRQLRHHQHRRDHASRRRRSWSRACSRTSASRSTATSRPACTRGSSRTPGASSTRTRRRRRCGSPRIFSSTGVDAPAIAHEVFESSPFGYLKLIGRVLDRAVLIEDERFVYSWFTRADLNETGVPIRRDREADRSRSPDARRRRGRDVQGATTTASTASASARRVPRASARSRVLTAEAVTSSPAGFTAESVEQGVARHPTVAARGEVMEGVLVGRQARRA